jgi:hypothetical protein
MTKTINFTFLLRNPDKVRNLVKSGVKLLVEFEGKVVMEINLPEKKEKKLLSNRPKHNIGINQPISREEIYSQSSWLDEGK